MLGLGSEEAAWGRRTPALGLADEWGLARGTNRGREARLTLPSQQRTGQGERAEGRGAALNRPPGRGQPVSACWALTSTPRSPCSSSCTGTLPPRPSASRSSPAERDGRARAGGGAVPGASRCPRKGEAGSDGAARPGLGQGGAGEPRTASPAAPQYPQRLVS